MNRGSTHSRNNSSRPSVHRGYQPLPTQDYLDDIIMADLGDVAIHVTLLDDDAITPAPVVGSGRGGGTVIQTSNDVTFVSPTETAIYGVDRDARYLYDPQSYYVSLETEDTVKCVASTVLFLLVVAFLLVIMFTVNPQM